MRVFIRHALRGFRGRIAMLQTLYWRLHQNFLMQDRIPQYRAILAEAKARGYQFLTISDLADCASKRARLPPLSLVLRNDVDSDCATARKMFEVDKALGIRATYYFRLSTLYGLLMRDIQVYGAEVGYHFEEVAAAAKRYGFREPADVIPYLSSIRESFRRNIKRYRSVAGKFPKTVASHGDFANRAIRTSNCCIVDQEIRDEFGIVAESYDEWLNSPVTMRLADCAAPRWWSPTPLAAALMQNPKCLYVLVHPRQWRANIRENIKIDVIRIAEGARLTATRAIRQCAAGPAAHFWKCRAGHADRGIPFGP